MKTDRTIFALAVALAAVVHAADPVANPTESAGTQALYRSDVPLVTVMATADAIKPKDPIQKVLDYLGQPQPQHKQQHFWCYFFAYGAPNDDNTPKATVTVWVDGDRVRKTETWFRPGLNSVKKAEILLKAGTPAEEVRKLFGPPAHTTVNRWSYSWRYSHDTEFSMDVSFTETNKVTTVTIHSSIVCEDEAD